MKAEDHEKRRREAAHGFTLIELMVVVLIIAILLAIAIPTFLGARERANDRGAQSNLRNAHTNALTYYTDGQAFTDQPDEMRKLDPSLVWTDVQADMALSPRAIYITVLDTIKPSDTVIVGAKSKSGDCFWLRAVGDKNLPRFAVNDCAEVPPPEDFQEQWD